MSDPTHTTNDLDPARFASRFDPEVETGAKRAPIPCADVTMAKIEHVARAICREQHLNPGGEAWGEDVQFYWMLFIPHAEAAIAALEEVQNVAE